MLSEEKARQLLSSAVDGQFCSVLKDVLKGYRTDGWLSISQAAAMAGLSIRSLQRRLAEEETDFSQLVEKARCELAIELLENSRTSLKEIAGVLGYS